MARALMVDIERLARHLGRRLLTLDTRTGDRVEYLSVSLGMVEEMIPRGSSGVLRFLVTAPAGAIGPVRQVIAAEITLNGRPFGPAAEGIVTVG